MATAWIYRLHIIINAEDVAAANAVASAVDPDVGGHLTFGQPSLSADGAPPATHTLTNTAATESMRLQMTELIASWADYGLSAAPLVWRLDAGSETLQMSTVTEATGQPWTVDDTLAAAGLQRVEATDGI